MILLDNERLDYVNDNLSLIQKNDGLTFGTDALLLAAYIVRRYECGVEIGGGSGIISMLLLTRNKILKADCVEVQESYAELISRNAELNSLSDRLTAVHSDIRSYRPEREYDTVFTNPPYMKATSGRENTVSAKNIARHEIFGDITDFAREGARLLKFGGELYAVYRPDRLIDLICALRESGLEVKRMTFVYADTASEPSMALVEAKKGAKSGMALTKPLIIYSDKEHKNYTDDMNYIMENGSFPESFKR